MAENILIPGPNLDQLDETTQMEYYDQHVIVLANGHYVIAWGERDYFDHLQPTTIRAQIFDPDGNSLTGQFQVNTTSLGQISSLPRPDTLLHMTALDGGGFVVTWNMADADGNGVYKQHFDNTGAAVGGEIQVNTFEDGDQSDAKVVAIAGGGYYVFWTEQEDNGGGDWEIRVVGQEYSAAGAAVGGVFNIVTRDVAEDTFYGTPEETYFNVQAARLANDEVVVSYYYSNADWDVIVQAKIIDSSGTVLAPVLEPMSTVDPDLPQQDIVALDNGNFMITYATNFDATGAVGVGRTEIYGAIYDAAGNVVQAETTLIGNIDDRLFDRSVVTDGNGGFILAYRQEYDNGDSGIFVQQFDGLGNQLGDRLLITELDTTQNRMIEIARMDDGSIVATWMSNFIGQGIYHRKLIWGQDNRFTSGDDTVVLGGSGESVIALEGDDTVTGGAGADNISGHRNRDVLSGAGGKDIIYGGGGNDTINGEQGADFLNGDNGADDIFGGQSGDTIQGGAGNDEIHGDFGDDSLYGQSGDDEIYGGAGNDTIYGYQDDNFNLRPDDADMDAAHSNSLYGGDDDDRIYGGDGADTIDGGDGDDIMVGSRFFASGLAGDHYVASLGADTVYAYADHDVMTFENLNNGITGQVVTTGSTIDRIAITIVNDSGASNFNQTQRINGIEEWILTNHDDVLYDYNTDGTILGMRGNDTLYGMDGYDVIDGDRGVDIIYGGQGRDTITGGNSRDTLYGDEANDVIYGGASIDKIYGGNSRDVLMGDEADDRIYGQSGNDTLIGGADDDRLFGGGGDDRLVGDEGDEIMKGGGATDTFVFDGDADIGTDTIKDFNNGSELIEISGSTEFGDLTIAVVGSDTHISWGAANLIILEGETGVIDSSDFDFT